MLKNFEKLRKVYFWVKILKSLFLVKKYRKMSRKLIFGKTTVENVDFLSKLSKKFILVKMLKKSKNRFLVGNFDFFVKLSKKTIFVKRFEN